MHNEKEALKEFETILKKYPDTELAIGVKMWFGEYFYDKGKFPEAKKSFSEIISKYPNSEFVDDAFYWLAWTLYEEGKLPQAAGEFRALYNNYPKSPLKEEAMVRAGDIFLEIGRKEEALNEFKAVTENFKGTTFARTASRKIGRIFMDKGDYLTAIEYLKNAQTADDTDFNAQIQYDIAEAHELYEDYGVAVLEYLKVSYMYPHSTFWAARAELKCANLLESMQKWDQAVNIYERLSKRGVKESEYALKRLEWLKRKE